MRGLFTPRSYRRPGRRREPTAERGQSPPRPVRSSGQGHDDLARHASGLQPLLQLDDVVEREGEQIGTLTSIGDLELASRLRWVYLGTEEADVVTGGYYWPFRAETFGGDDVVTGSGKRDRIDAGDGTDRVVGNEGRDTCLNAEDVTSCEVLAE